MKISNYLSSKISHIMVVMTLFVVYMHYSSSYIHNVNNVYVFRVVDYFGQAFSRNAVPLFFFISGVLAFWKVNDRQDLIRGAKKRLYTLGIPYLIWNTIGMLYFLLMDRLSESLIQIDFMLIIKSIFLCEYNFHFWYIRYLIVLSCIAPFILGILNNKRVAILFIVALFVCEFIPILHLAKCSYYFLGAYLALHHKEILNTRIPSNLMLVSLLLFVILQLIRLSSVDYNQDFVAARGNLVYRVYEIICPILLFFSLDVFNFEKHTVSAFGKQTFFVYAGHIILVSILSSNSIEQILGLKISSPPIYVLIVYLIIPIFIYALLSIVSLVVKKINVSLYNLLTGGR